MSIRHPGVVFAALLLSVLVACAPREEYRGAVIDEDKLAQIEVGKTTQAQVSTLMGSPSTSSTFPEWGTTYFYISSQTEAIAFMAPDLIDQQVVSVSFDENSRVKEVKRYGMKDGKQVAFVSRETPTRGKEMTVLEQLFGNFGRFVGNNESR